MDQGGMEDGMDWRRALTYIHSVQFSHSVLSHSLRPHGLQHTRPSCPSPTPGACSTHVHRVSDAIQPSHPLLSPSPPAFNLSTRLLLLLLSRFSHVRLCATPEMAAHQAPPSLGFSRQEGVGCHCLLQCMKVKSESEVAQLCPILRNPMDCSPPGSSVHGIFQARVLEWGAIAFSLLVYSSFILTVSNWKQPR